MIYAAGASLPELLTSEEIGQGLLYPVVDRIREVSVRVARRVIRAAQKDGVNRAPEVERKDDEALDEWIRKNMYDPYRHTD